MNYPITFKDVLPVKDFIFLQDELKLWSHGNGSNQDEEDQSKKFFGQPHRHDRIQFYNAATIVLLKIKKKLKKDLKLIRIHTGAKLFGTLPEFHVDSNERDKCWTFVLFASMQWNTNWGGEFVCQDPLTKEYKYTPYIPNNGVLIPGHWEHTGTAPLTIAAGLRKSIAFSFTPQDNYQKFIENYPRSILFS